MNEANIPILGAKAFTPSELCIIDYCRHCGSAIFAHTRTTTRGPAVYPTCGCDHSGISFTLPNEYDGDREREITHLLFQYLGQLVNELTEYATLFGPLPVDVQFEDVVDAESEVVA